MSSKIVLRMSSKMVPENDIILSAFFECIFGVILVPVFGVV